MPPLRRFAGPAFSFLIGSGLQVIGYTNTWLGAALLLIGAIWGLIALFTWEPIAGRLSSWRIARSASVAEAGFLDFMLNAERLPRQMGPVLTRIATDTTALSVKMHRHTQHIIDEQAHSKPDSTAR